MKKLLVFLMANLFLIPAVAMAATLQNTDSQGYELQILEPGQPYSSRYRIIENAKAEICPYGCELTLLRSGQTVWVNRKDTVVIDDGVMTVAPGD